MKKLLLIIAFATTLLGQTNVVTQEPVVKNAALTSTQTAIAFDLSGTGATAHSITATTNFAISGVTLTVYGNNGNGEVTQGTISNTGSLSFNGAFRFIRVAESGMTAASPNVQITYSGRGDTDGASTCYVTTAATTNATNCKAGPGSVQFIRGINTTATLYYLRMYNLAAAPTCSSATGFIESIPIPANVAGAGMVSPMPTGQRYSTGIGFCITDSGASTGNGAAATGVYVTILYK